MSGAMKRIRSFFDALEVAGLRYGIPIIQTAIVAVGLWKWLVEGDIRGLQGIILGVAVYALMHWIYWRAARFPPRE